MNRCQPSETIVRPRSSESIGVANEFNKHFSNNAKVFQHKNPELAIFLQKGPEFPLHNTFDTDQGGQYQMSYGQMDNSYIPIRVIQMAEIINSSLSIGTVPQDIKVVSINKKGYQNNSENH